MAWRKILLIITLVVGLNACSLPQEVSFFQSETPRPESRALSPGTVEQPGAASPQDQQNLPASTNESEALQGRYAVQPGTPVGVVNFVDPAAGCNWTGVGGQVFALNSEPVTGLTVQLGGELGGKQLNQLAITGGAQAFGPGGFLFVLGNQPVASQGRLWLQLFDPGGSAVSNKAYFDTYAGCDRNLILVNFTERLPVVSTNYLPVVANQRLYYYFPFVGQK